MRIGDNGSSDSVWNPVNLHQGHHQGLNLEGLVEGGC